MASLQTAEKNKKSLARFFPNIKKTVARFFLQIKNFHICMRLTRMNNESGVDLLWIPVQLGRPMAKRHWRELPREHYMDVNFRNYTTHNPEVNTYVHVYPKIDNNFPRIEIGQPIVYPNGVEGRQVCHVLTSDLIRELSTINLYVNNQNTVHTRNNVSRDDLPKGFSWCFSAPLNEARSVAAADQPELANDTSPPYTCKDK